MAAVNNLFAGMGTRHLEVPSAVRSMSPNSACKAQDCGLLAHGIKRTPSGQPLYT
ncbi:hypothetical protein IEO21_08932 [Rhodonia placenta]|uniref:Uncharacterized protein n=1 Tax=Rhodonia placenta TaxID=104341 RepID=A0A8H7NVH7_9APHY|nr:hypothetical protein IEO21_08932 [Postia placenta]